MAEIVNEILQWVAIILGGLPAFGYIWSRLRRSTTDEPTGGEDG